MKNNAGAIRTAWHYLEIFHQSGIIVDYVHSADTWGMPMAEEEAEAIRRTGLVREIYSLRRKPGNTGNLRQWLRYRLQRLWRDLSPRPPLPNFVTTYNQYLFNKILQQHSYDYIVISYVYWTELVKMNPYIGQARLIVDTHDFLTAQEQSRYKFDIGKMFAEEIKRLSIFEQIWTVSIEERYLFQQFINKKVLLVPVCSKDHTRNSDTKKRYDIIYVASDNSHNVKAANWFFKEVYPLLDASLNWCVIGAIHKHVPEGENIDKISYAANLDTYYNNARVAVCPMLSGTGVKVKVIEALSYGLPVVCSPGGLDGLANKTDNGCVMAPGVTEFETALRKLLSDSNYYMEVKAKAIAYFQANHSYENLRMIIGNALSDKNRI